MQKSRLLEVFLSLSSKDLRELRKFINSPYFNQRSDVIALFEYLAQHHPFKDAKVIDRIVVYSAIFRKDKYNEKEMAYTMSFLFQCIKDYLAHNEFTANQANKQLYVAKALHKRGLDRVFESEIKLAKKTLKEQAFRNIDYHYNHFSIEEEYLNYSRKQNKIDISSFKAFNDELYHFYLASKLRQLCMGLSSKVYSKLESELKNSEQLFKEVETNNYDKIPAIAIYYYIGKALSSDNNIDYFEKLQLLIHEHHSVFPKNEFKDVLLLSINYAIIKLNEGDKSYLRKLLNLYREGLESGALLENDLLSQSAYNNIARIGIGLKEFDWVQSFLVAYRPLLKKSVRDDCYNYNLAVLYWRQLKYDEVMLLLQQVEFKDTMNNLLSRRMLLKIYYEKEELRALQSLLDSFKNYIYRHKDIGFTRSNYLNLIRYVRKLLALDRYDKSAKQKLRGKIEGEKYLVEREWLLAQL